MKLAAKTSLVIGLILTIILVSLIVVTVLKSKSAIETSINGEFEGIAKQNGLMVQAVFDEATSTAVNLQDYLQYTYGIYENMTDAEKAVTKPSVLYPVNLQEIKLQCRKLHIKYSMDCSE